MFEDNRNREWSVFLRAGHKQRTNKQAEIVQIRLTINPLTANDALPNYPSTAEAVNAVT